MFNLVKYELKGYFKDFIIIASLIALAHLLLFTRLKSWPGEPVFMVSWIITCASMFVVFIWTIKVFLRDLYSDSGYLLFTTPESGYSILGSKILTAFIQNIVVGLVAGIFNFLTLHFVGGTFAFINFSKAFESLDIRSSILILLSAVLQYAFFLLIVYFSISLGKIAIKNKKIGKLSGFAIFVFICYIMIKISDALASVFPQSIAINLLKPSFNQTMTMSHSLSLNIANLVFNVVIFIGLFIGTSYILENKIDL